MRFKITCLTLAVMLGTIGTGCTTTPSSATREPEGIELTLTQSGSILADGQATDLDHLTQQLRRAGATLATPITIKIPADTPLTIVSAISSRLASAGYRRILFKRPQRADASTEPSPRIIIPTTP